MDSYTRTDLRSLAFHKLIVKKLTDKPQLWDVVYDNLKKTCHSTVAYNEWHELIKSKNKSEIIKVLCEKNETSQRLRSSSPFLNIITADERLKIFNKFKR